MNDTSNRKLTVRQISIRDDSQFTKTQKTLRKQSSLGQKEEDTKQIRIQSAKGRLRSLEKHPIKLAWTEDNNINFSYQKSSQQTFKNTRSCENSRILFRNSHHSSIENINVHSHHQQLQRRLEETWKRKQNRQNINIYIKQSGDIREKDKMVEESKVKSPKIISPLYPEALNENLFQKKLKNVNSIQSNSITTEKGKPKAVVVVPLIKNCYDETYENEDTIFPEDNNNITENLKQNSTICFDKINVKSNVNNLKNSVPKKEVCQKRNDNFRPPLLRASSLPTKLDKPKFVAHKRRIKSAKYKDKNKKYFQRDDEDEQEMDFSQEKFRNGFHKFIQFSGSEIITMVSLVSPDQTDAEDNCDDKNNTQSDAIKESSDEKLQKSLSSRKNVKTVSFQQGSIHAVRSFSASFPGRRRPKLDKMQEKEIILDNNPPKRRNTRTSFSETERNNGESKLQSFSPKNTQNKENVSIEENIEKLNEEKTVLLTSTNSKGNVTNENFETDKEKQCWDLYKKVSQKGVSVTFDTILRGMLTPTEYRLRRSHSLAEVELTNNNIPID